jgi:hypothetical protein
LFADVHFEEAIKAFKDLGWYCEGKFVRIVLEVVATMGLTSKVEIEKLMNKEVYSSRKISTKMLCLFFCALYLAFKVIF